MKREFSRITTPIHRGKVHGPMAYELFKMTFRAGVMMKGYTFLNVVKYQIAQVCSR